MGERTAQAVILAGGKGTRLAERLNGLPKPLVDIDGVPLLERQILLLKRHGLERILVLVNHRADAIRAFVASRGGWGLDVDCADDGTPRGTAGAVLDVLERLDDTFLVVYGDTMLDVDVGRFLSFHARAVDAAATLFVHPNDHPHDSDLIEVDDGGFVRGFHGYPHAPDKWLPNLVNAALYGIHRRALEPWVTGDRGVVDFAKELFPRMLAAGQRLCTYNSPEYIKDCGTPGRLDRVVRDVRSGRVARANLLTSQRAVFVDRDGTLNVEVDHLRSSDQLVVFDGVEGAVRRLNDHEYRVCVVTNQPVVARGECSEEDLGAVHAKLETLLGRSGAFVDRIALCPHHPDRGFPGEREELKVDCDCRKPKTGMIDRLSGELNVDRSASWLVGDSTTDLMTARRAGLRSILVETGYAGLDGKYDVLPDYTVPDFRSAVDLIVDRHARLRDHLAPLLDGVGPGARIIVGGQARSGKSNVASCAAELLRERGLRTHLVATDRWILPEAERGTGVRGRHDLAALSAALRPLFRDAGGTHVIDLPFYRRATRTSVRHAETLAVLPEDVVLVEGVTALDVSPTRQDVLRLFVSVPEEVRRGRFFAEYARRGATAAETTALYESRLADEVPVVEAGRSGATIVDLSRVKGWAE